MYRISISHSWFPKPPSISTTMARAHGQAAEILQVSSHVLLTQSLGELEGKAPRLLVASAGGGQTWRPVFRAGSWQGCRNRFTSNTSPPAVSDPAFRMEETENHFEWLQGK